MGTMCSYAGLNGVPSCANDYLLNQVIRSPAGFNRSDVVVGTDCGAVNNMVSANHYATDSLDAAAKTLNGGTDMELGDQEWSAIANGGSGLLTKALEMKRVTEERVSLSVERILRLRFLTGQFDPVDAQPYTKITADAVNSTAAQQLNLEAALQSLVLLKNEAKTLPFKKGVKTAVLGPHVLSQRDLMSDYKGDMQCVGGSDDFSCIPTIAAEFTAYNGADNTVVVQGVEIASDNSTQIDAALAAAGAAEQVLLFIGIGSAEEHEGIDRHNTSLPGLQESFTLQVLALCKQKGIPAAVIMINAGALAIDPIVPVAPAIVEAFYPSVRGAKALALTLFGEQNRWGKLPVTMYDKDYINQVDFHNFEMSKPPGRTYKYYTGTPLFPFGHGLSYNPSMSLQCVPSKGKAPMLLSLDCNAQTSGGVKGDEVLMAFHSVDDSIRAAAAHPVPIKELVGFLRGHYDPNLFVSEFGTIEIGPNQLGVVDQDGNLQLIKGTHVIEVTNGAQYSQKFNITVDASRVLRTVPAVPA
eukprot:TRINITY_DN7716_c0_g1_i1.p1 TRINITY_DN7716_c0_g1~~TRINITY_DN7716_c0_g1_i1.p1  ORF type:complete len:526 (-),score=141.07 TRINITY_DN7716_c0_g1_i1:109-1686(-)